MPERKWRHDDPIKGTQCPTCGSPITYNGNYFCTNFTYPYDGRPGTCDWALPEEPYCTPEERHLFNVAYTTLMLDRGDEPKADALWLDANGIPW